MPKRLAETYSGGGLYHLLPKAFIAIARDITELKRAEEERRTLRRKSRFFRFFG